MARTPATKCKIILHTTTYATEVKKVQVRKVLAAKCFTTLAKLF